MEKAKGEIDSLNGDVTIALLPLAGDVHVIQSEMLEFLHCPRGEHQPRYDRIEQENDGIGDPGGHTAYRSVRHGQGDIQG